MNMQPDFIAELTYLTSEQGGRKTPVFSGYRPQVKFGFHEMQTSGQQRFIDKETVCPGESVIVEITLLSKHFLKRKLTIGSEFDFREGSKIIGTGVVKEILNLDLSAS